MMKRREFLKTASGALAAIPFVPQSLFLRDKPLRVTAMPSAGVHLIHIPGGRFVSRVTTEFESVGLYHLDFDSIGVGRFHEKRGHVNDRRVTLIVERANGSEKKYEFGPEAVLFTGYEIRRDACADGLIRWKVKLKLSASEIGWNNLWHPNRGWFRPEAAIYKSSDISLLWS